jgi:copper chaperone CopZ
MRKLTLLAAALAVTVGAASAMACDHDKASSASASKASSGSCCSSSSNTSASLTSAGKGECSDMKSASAGSCAAHKNAGAMSVACKDGDVADAVFQVASIHGDCCVSGVASALTSVKGVQYVNVDVKTKKAYVCTRGAKIDQKVALHNLKEAGFTNAVYLGADKKYSMKDGVKASSKTTATSKV